MPHISPDTLILLAGNAITVAFVYGMLVQRVRDHDRRIETVEDKIDKWQEAGIGVKLQSKAHSAHGD